METAKYGECQLATLAVGKYGELRGIKEDERKQEGAW